MALAEAPEPDGGKHLALSLRNVFIKHLHPIAVPAELKNRCFVVKEGSPEHNLIANQGMG